MTIGHDGVVTTMHVLDSGSGVVAFSRVGTGGTCVVAVETKAMGPAIVHVKPIISDNGPGVGGCGWNRCGQCTRQ